MTLYAEKHGVGRAVALVHGLFGSSVNWRGIVRRLASHHSVYNLDLLNHGHSSHAESMTYGDMSTALHEFQKEAGVAKMDWVGHSMGGKAVMDLSLKHPDCVRKLVVIDIAPVSYAHSHAAYIDAMLAIDLEVVANRADAERRLRDAIPDSATRLFLLQNLVLEKGKFRWRLNLPVIRRHLSDIMTFPVHTGATFSGPTLILSGEHSDYVCSRGRQAALGFFPSAEFEVVPNAGHWVHADQPQSVSEAISRFIDR